MAKLKPKDTLKKIKKNVEDLTLPDQTKRRAVAVKYDHTKDKAPKILAVGKASMADMILQIAEEHRIPFYEDDSLVSLLSKLEINSEIPPELYSVIAEILAFVYQLDKLAKRKKGRSNKN